MCLACGRPLENRRRRYCHPGCKNEFLFKLHWFNNLLRVLNTRYATFAFNHELLILNVLPLGSNQNVHTYFYARRPGKKPAQDMQSMVFELGGVWWGQKNKSASNMQAGQEVLNKGRRDVFDPDSIRPIQQHYAARVSRQMAFLQIKPSEIKDVMQAEEKIKNAFRRAALENHPDQGGSSKSFRQIYQAYQDLLAWLQKPVFHSRQGVPQQWCFIAARNRWVTPL